MEGKGLEELYDYTDLSDFENFTKFMRRIDII